MQDINKNLNKREIRYIYFDFGNKNLKLFVNVSPDKVYFHTPFLFLPHVTQTRGSLRVEERLCGWSSNQVKTRKEVGSL